MRGPLPWRRLAGPAVVVAAVLLLVSPVLAGRATLVHRDTARQLAPLRSLIVPALREGRLPLWNPHQYAGMPLFAESLHGTLHPLSLAAAWLAPDDLDPLLVGWLLAAALGAWTLARVLGASEAAAAAAGLGYGLAGFTLSMTGMMGILAGAASLPWTIAAARAAGAGVPLGAAATAAATGAAFLAGDPQAAPVGIALGLALAADAGGARGALRALCGAAAGVLLAGVQLLATRALLPVTNRGLPVQAWEAARWALEPARLLELAVPGLFAADPATKSAPLYRAFAAAAEGGSAPAGEPFAESIHVGAAALLLAALGARGRTGRILAGAAAALGWMAAGTRLGATQLLAGMPGWGQFRYAEKLAGPLTLCLVLLAATGVDRVAREGLPRGARRAALGLAAAAALGAIVAWLAPGAVAGALPALGGAGPFVAGKLGAGLAHAAAGLALLAAACAALRARPALVAPALAALIALQAAAASGQADAFHDPRSLEGPVPDLALHAEMPGPRVVHPYFVDVQRVGPLVNFDADRWMERAVLLAPTNVARRVDVMDGYSPFIPRRYMAAVDLVGERVPNPWVLSERFGATNAIVQPPFDEASAARARALTGTGTLAQSLPGSFEVWDLPHRAWAFFARSAIAAPDLPAAAERLRGAIAAGDQETVVVEAPEAPPTSPGSIVRLQRHAEDLRITAEAEGPGLLVVNDAYWPGWRAWIDGVEVEILAADVLMRAVRWPAGRHVAIFRYEPPEIPLGLGVSAAGAIATALLGARGLRRRKAPPRAEPPPVDEV